MVVFLYTSNEQTRKEKRKIILFKMTSKRIKYWGLNIYREVKYLYSENDKTLLIEIQETPVNQRIS